jgi:RNA polymerase sigma-70 factor (ECF subfamily)
MNGTGARDPSEAASAVARRSYGKLVAYLASRTRDVAAAEDALSEAFARALADWPERGVPQNPEAWLLTAARRKLIDAARRGRAGQAAIPHLQLLAQESSTRDVPPIPDHRLALMFACAHPSIEPSIRAPLILQTLLGLDAAAIASAFLVAPSTMGQRLWRAKAKIREAAIPLRIPDVPELAPRLGAVLDAIYAAFAESWTDAAGTDVRRRNLAEEALWLARLVVSLLPDEPEALGLLSLMLHAEARRNARRSAAGDYIPLANQDTALWDRAMIAEAENLLIRANTLHAIGRYQLEAAVQSAHAARVHRGRTDWSAIEQLYDGLLALTGSPVVAVNRAIAIAENRGHSAGLAALERIAGDARLQEYQPYWAARAHLLSEAGDLAAADRAFERAIGLEADPAVRQFLQRRRAACQLRERAP